MAGAVPRCVLGPQSFEKRIDLPGISANCWLKMEVSEAIQCPFCGRRFELVIDTSVASQRFTTDCEVCCRPFEVIAESEPGDVLSLEVAES